MGEKAILDIIEMLQSELSSTCWKEASGGSDYSEHKNKIRSCLDELNEYLDSVRYPDQDYND